MAASSTEPASAAPQDQRRRRWGEVLLLLLLLLLTPLCLLAVGQAGIISSRVSSAPLDMLSALQADYAAWDRAVFQPVDPILIATIQADEYLQAGLPVPTLVAQAPAAEPSVTAAAPPTSSPGAAPTQPPNEGGSGPPPAGGLPASPPPEPTSAPVTSLPATLAPTSVPASPAPAPTEEDEGADEEDDSPSPDPQLAISGQVLLTAYTGGLGTPAGAVCDAARAAGAVQVTLTDLTAASVEGVQVIDAGCGFSFTGLEQGHDYRLSVDASTFAGPAWMGKPSIPEQVYERAQGGAGALGGDDPNNPNDHTLTLTNLQADVTDAVFVFSYGAVTNNLPTGQGSLEQAIINANAMPDVDMIRFITAVLTVTPSPAGLSPLVDAGTSIAADGSSITLDGGAGSINRGLIISADGVTIDGLVIRGFNQEGIRITEGNNVRILNNHLEGNMLEDTLTAGQIHVVGGPADSGLIDGNHVLNGRGDGIRIDENAAAVGWQITNNIISGNNFDAENEGVSLRATQNTLIAFNTISQNGHGLRIFLHAPGNTISHNSFFNNDYAAVDFPDCPTYAANDCLAPPDTAAQAGLQIQVVSGVGAADTLEVFLSDGAGEGWHFCLSQVGPATVDLSGLMCSGISVTAGLEVVTTVTNPAGSTSPFSTEITLLP